MPKRLEPAVPGFTLLELIQVMIMVAILVTLIGGSVFYFSRYHKSLEQELAQQSQFNLLYLLMHQDAQKYRFYELGGSSLSFASKTDTVLYQLGSSVIRQQGVRTDTFSIAMLANPSVAGVSFQAAYGDRTIRFILPKDSIPLLHNSLSSEY